MTNINSLNSREKKIISARAGEVWNVNDKFTRGHKSQITKRKGVIIEHIPRTHKSKTRNMRNVKLQQNPQPGDKRDCYVLPKVQKTNIKNLGKKHNEPIKNSIDKSVIRHIKNNNKKK